MNTDLTSRHIPQFEFLEPRLLLASNVIITEFMASNDSTIQDGTGSYADWVEIQNVSSNTVNLAGWSLATNKTNQSKWWQFPSFDLASGAYAIVYCTGDDPGIPGELHASFKLGASGDYLALIEPDHATKASEFAPNYPAQNTDVSYGVRETVSTTPLIEGGASVWVCVPSEADGSMGFSWTQMSFDSSGWTSGHTGVGYDITMPAPTASLPAATPQSPAPGLYYGPTGNGTWNLYEVITTPATWIDAYNAAKTRTYGGITGHLATVGSAAENAYLKSLITTNTWIGLTDSDTFASLGAYEAGNTSALTLPAAGVPPVPGERGYGFVWVTGESFGYQNWSSGQPDDSGGEDAIEMYSADGKWNDNKSGEAGQANGTTKQYIVEYDVGDRFVFGPYGPAGSLNFYQVVSETGTWQEAQDAAAASSQYGQAGHLVSINSAAENEFVRSLMGGAGWIGLTDGSAFGGTEMGDTSGLALPAAGQVPGAGQRGEGFVWTSGQPFTYQNWSAGQPDDGAGAGSQDAAEMATDGTWSDALTSGASRGVYVIEYDLGYTSANSRLVYGPYGPGGTWNLYEVVTGTTSWLDAYYAAKTSVERGKTGHLVSITSAAENNFVKSLLSTSAWIGLTDSGTFGGTEKGDTSGASLPPDGSAPTSAQRGYGFKWVTSEGFTYQNWAGGQPDDGSGAGTQDGVALAVNGTWSDERDGEVGQTGVTAGAYVIEYDLNQKFFYGPYGPGGTWNLYELAPTAMTWVDAKADAATQAQGGQTGHLVTVGSAAENNFIKSLVSADTWLGLTDSETFGGSEKGNTSALPLPAAGQAPGAGQRGEGFVWVTGDPFTYQNWNSGQPDDASPGQDAGYITTGGTWYDEMSGEGLQTGTIKQYVIEYETGLSAVGPLMKVERVSTVSNIPTVAEAVAVLNSRTPAVYYAPVVNFSDPQQTGGGRFGGDLAYPGDTPAADVTYALRVTGTIRIPTAGDWTFDVNSDDGASLRIIGQTFKSVAGAGTTFSGDTMLYSGTRGANTDSLGVTTLGVGEYQFELVYFQSTGGSMLEFSAAPGAYTSIPSPSPFRLVGDSLNGGLAVSGIPNLATTNLAAQMYGKNSSAYLRVPFTVAEDAAFNHLHLEMQYDDGFVAFIDGVEVARSNAPASLAWNSAATASRGGTSANTPHEFDIYRTLAPGNHVLAIQGLNASAADSDFLVLPELYGVTVLSTDLRYFTTPSPGWANSEGIAAFVKDTQFSNDRGFYTTPFDLTITSATAGATIRYTTDGSTPTSNTGTVYTGPLRIDHTTILRAAAFKTDWDSTDVDTETYLFISDIIGQSLNGQAPAGWPTGPINSQILDYGMDPDIVNNPLYWNLLYDALTEIPSISLVTDLSNLFDPLTGIYVNPKQDGSGWERPTSVELINPDGTDGFQIDAGLRIRGGYSRDPSNPKHGFRLIFKDQYDGTLHYALFGDEGVDQFENVDLRTSENYSWSFGGDSRNIMVRDLFNRMTQRDMGDPYTRSRFYHLYIDGEYWGIYMTEERPEADYAADYFGGDKDDYDVIKVDTDTYTMFATDGNLDAYTRLYNAAVAGFESNDAYLRVLGCNPDGTRNPAYEVQVDPVNLIDYMLSIYWSGDLDAPCSNFLGNLKPNNIYCIRDHTGDTGWQFFRHDGEHTLLDVNQNRVYGTTASPANTYFWTGGDQLQYFNPQWLHQKLMENAEYKQLFDDRVQKFFTNGGALTPEACLARFDSLTNMIDMAIVAESARWGDAKVTTPKTKVDWQTEVNRIRTAFIPQRTAIVLNQFNTTPDPHATTVPAPTLSWLSSVAAPTFSQFGGPIASVEPWFDLTITAPAGTIYYTLDGTDPRLLFGAKATGALLYTGPIELTKSTRIMARAAVDDGFGNLTWSALSDATFVRDTPSGLRITEVMYHPADPPSGSQYIDDDFQFIELLNTGAVPLGLAGYRLSDGVDFEFPDITVAPGQCFLVVANQDAFLSRYPTVPTGKIIGQFGGYLAQGGEYIQLDAGLDGTLQRFEYKDGWFADTDGEGFSLVVLNPGQDRALWDDKDGWRPSRAAGGSPGEADTDVAPGSMVINEILAHQDTEAPGDWIELKNVSAAAIDISGWFLSDDPNNLMKYRIPDGTTPIPAGGFIVFDEYHNFGRAENPGVLIPFGFSELGEAAYLTGAAPDGSAGGYRESETLPATDRDVAYGRFIKSTGDKDFVAMAAATPGAENSYPAAGLVHLGDGTFADPGVVINEILYDPVAGTDEFIELYNLTDEAVPLYDPAHPGNRWKFTAGLGSNYSLPAGATIPAHGYALVVPIDPAAFRTKYGIPAGVPIYGPYTGSLSNNGEAVELARPGDPELDGTVPYYRVDRVNYSQAAPWPTRAGMAGSSIVRTVAGAYGNEPANWTAGTTGGTPGRAASPLDVTPPTVPAGLTAVSGLAQICLSWTGSTDPESGVAYYRIYRNNAGIGTSLTTSYTDALVVAGVAYSYQVSAVSRDDPESAKSNASAARIVTVTSVTPLSTTSVKVVFSEAMNKASAETVANYAITYATGSMTLSSASLASDNVTLTLTLSTPMVFDRLYTFTPTGVVSTSGYTIAAGSQKTFNYYISGTGYIYREWWTGITGTAVSNLTSNANYPNSPTGRAETNLFEAPSNFADNYGTRMRGYVTAPVTGTYYFWIASDDGSELWLNPNGEDPAGKVKIAYTTSATGSREWTKYATQKSAAITLQAGQRYYIEALQKEGSGNDFLAVTWQLPGATFSSTQAPIAGTYLSPIAPPLVTPDMTVTIAATTPTGNEASTVKGQCTVTRTGNLVPAVTVYYTVGGTATTTDFTAPSGWVTIVAGATTATIDVKPVDDTLDEPDETVILTLNPSHATYAVGSPASATVTIIDNDLPLVNIAATDPNAAEQGLDTGTFTFTRVGQLTSSLAVNFTISGTATRTTDYSGSPALVSGTNTFTFDVGVSSVIYVITPVDDAVIDAGETVILTISSNANYSRGTPNNATVTIADNDAPVVSIAATDPNAAEQGLDTGTFTVSRTGPTTASLTVNYTVAGTAASGIDFANIGTSVTLGVGVASKTITVTPVDDSASETAETVIVTLSTNGTLYTLDPAKVATVTIADNDPAVVTLLATDAAASEQGRDSGTFTLTRVGDLTAAVTVNYTVGGTATADDYGPTLGGSVAFGSGVASVTIVVTPVDDVADEIDETVILTLATGAGYGIGSPSSATVTIADNDLPAVVLRATDSHAYEAGQHKGTFTFTRDGYLGSALTAYYTVGGTAATSGAYNPALTGVVTFGVGQTSVTIDVTPVDDSIDEPMQAVVLALKPDANYVFGSSKSATVTIADNDLPTVSVTATDPLAAEAGLDKGTYTFTRVGDLSAALTLHYAVVGGTATPADYQPLAGYVTFEIGQAAATADLIPVDNQITEPDKTVVLAITADPAYTVTGSPATVTINAAPVVTGVKLNGLAGRGPGAVDPSGLGVRTIVIDFNEAVTFATGDVTVQTVRFVSGAEEVVTAPAASVAGSGTSEMTITLPYGAAVDTWVKVRLAGSAIADLAGHRLDGEARSGDLFIVDAATDLPTGNGVEGGDAVFYVGSLRGDMNLDNQITAADKAAFLAKWAAEDLDADFRGTGFGVRPPDGRITLGDMDGFASAYLAASAAGRSLAALPSGHPLGDVTPLPALAGAPGGVDILAEAAGKLPASPMLPGSGSVLTATSPDDSSDPLSVRQAYATAAEDVLASVLRI